MNPENLLSNLLAASSARDISLMSDRIHREAQDKATQRLANEKIIDLNNIQNQTNEVLSKLKDNSENLQTLQLETFKLLLAEIKEQGRLQKQAADDNRKAIQVNFWINIFLALVATITIVQYVEGKINKTDERILEKLDLMTKINKTSESIKN